MLEVWKQRGREGGRDRGKEERKRERGRKGQGGVRIYFALTGW